MNHSLTKFLIFLIFLTYPTNYVASAKPKLIVTDELINTICAKTKNKSDCLQKLSTLKGKSLFPNPVAVLGASYMGQALSKSATITNLYERKYQNTESSLRLRYHICFEKYKEVFAHLYMARRFMLSGNADSVDSLTNVARNNVDYCDKELMKAPKLEAKAFLDDNSKFKDICWVISAICKNVRKLK